MRQLPRRPLSLHRHLTSLRNRRTRNIRRLPLRSQRPSPQHWLLDAGRPAARRLPRNPGARPKTWRRAGWRSAPRRPPGDNFVGDREEGGSWGRRSTEGRPMGHLASGQALGQIVPAAVDALATAEEIGVAGAEGFLQGAANLLNSGTDAVFGLANLVPRIYNNTAGNLGYRPLSDPTGQTGAKGWLPTRIRCLLKINRGAGDVAVAAGSFVLGPKIPAQPPGLSLLGDSWSAMGRGGSRPSTEASDSRPGRYRAAGSLGP